MTRSAATNDADVCQSYVSDQPVMPSSVVIFEEAELTQAAVAGHGLDRGDPRRLRRDQ